MKRLREFFGKLGERGTAAIEFALVGPLFLMLMLGIFELGIMVFVQSVLDGSAREAARLIRTGQAQANGNPQADFQATLCNAVTAIVGCGNIIYQSEVFATWTSAQAFVNTPPARSKQGNLISGGFTPGTCGSIVVVQVSYNYPFYTQWIGGMLGGATNTAFLMSTVVFQNEPFCA